MWNEEDKLMQLVDEMGQGRLTSPENALHVERTEFITSFIGSMAQATSEPLGFGAKNAERLVDEVLAVFLNVDLTFHVLFGALPPSLLAGHRGYFAQEGDA